MSFFLIVIVLFGAFWLLFVLPARRRRQQHAGMQDSVEAGDEIITAGGIHAKVIAEEGETVQAEIAAGVVVTLDRRAIAAVATEVEVDAEAEAEDAAPEEAPAPETSTEPR
jgi:preprotein translocase subunit YajC